MSKPFQLRIRDNGYSALVRQVFGFGRPKIKVGILEGGGAHPGGGTVAEVAEKHEFGYGVPGRSFLRAWFDAAQDQCLEAMRRLMESVLKGTRTKGEILDLAGLAFVGQIQKRISAGIAPPNSPATIAKKGSSTPLIDTGQLRSSITHKVEGGT